MSGKYVIALDLLSSIVGTFRGTVGRWTCLVNLGSVSRLLLCCGKTPKKAISRKATFHSQSDHEAIGCVVVIDGATTNTANEALLHHIKTVISSQPGSPLPCLEARSGTDASAEILRKTAGMSPPDAGS